MVRLRLAEEEIEKLRLTNKKLRTRVQTCIDTQRFLHALLLEHGIEVPRRADGKKVVVR